MNFDLTFPHYAEKMVKYLWVLAVLGAVILFLWKGWPYGVAWGLGSLFHIFFFKFLLLKFKQWEKAKRDVEFIGHRLVVFTMLRFILEILCCVAVIFTPLDILAFLGGLLTLPAATLGERLVGLIKE